MSTGVQTKAAPAAGQHADGPRLLADIGGTNARFALETGPGEITQVPVYPCADYPGVAEVIKKYLKDTKIGRVNHAAIAIANPVDGDQVKMTNHDWTFSIEATRRALGFDTLLVVNDFTALAMALLANPRVLILDEPLEAIDPVTALGITWCETRTTSAIGTPRMRAGMSPFRK